jgi:CBS domain-containing protein
MITRLEDIIEQATTIAMGTPLEQAIALIRESGTDQLVLTDDAERPVGVVSDFTLLKAVLRGESRDFPVDRLASPLDDTLTPDQPLQQVALFFRCGYRSRMVVVADGRVRGIVRRTRLLLALDDSSELAEDREPAVALTRSRFEQEVRLIG